MTDLEVHQGLIALAHGHHVRLDLLRDRSQNLMQGMSQHVGAGLAKDVLGSAIHERNLVVRIRRDDTAGYRIEHVVHQVLERRDLFQGAAQGGEQPSVLHSHSRLIGKCRQQIPVAFRKNAGPDSIVGVDDSDEIILDLEGHTQDRAQIEGNNAGGAAEASIVLRVGRDDSLPGFDYALDDRPAGGCLAGLNGLLGPVASHLGRHLPARISQHQESALSPGQADDIVHHDPQHLIQFQR